MIQPQDLGLKHLEFHSQLCPFQIIKTSFVLKLVHCALNSIINTWHHQFLSDCGEWRPLLYPEISGVLCLPSHSIFQSHTSFQKKKKRIHNCPCFWTFGIVFFKNQKEGTTSLQLAASLQNMPFLKGSFWRQKLDFKM